MKESNEQISEDETEQQLLNALATVASSTMAMRKVAGIFQHLLAHTQEHCQHIADLERRIAVLEQKASPTIAVH